MIITGFQLRAAKVSLNLGYDRLCTDTGISRVTLGRLVNTINNFEEIKCSAQDAYRIYEYFLAKGLLFPNKTTISMNYEVEHKSCIDNMTRFQFIVSRTAINMTQRELAKHIGLSHGVFYSFEEQDNSFYIRSRKMPIKNIIDFFKEKNLIFPDNKSVQINNL